MPLSAGLCPPVGQVLNLQGKASSGHFSILTLDVTRCNSTLDPFCANDTVFAAYEASVKTFDLIPMYINTNINPRSQNYKDYFLEDQNLFYFNTQLGVRALATIAEDTIKTD